uniref:Integrase catalytic domain-containing protein n=1 Tax=Triticum urartu TaxID=4572 RepID=A0A8R7V9Y7_TRIUA
MQEGRPVSYFSRTIGPKAAAMSTYDKEALAIIEVVKKWKHYLATSLVIRTDRESLKYIQEQKLTEGIQHKLLLKLLGYNFTVEYKKGKENKAADALSRVKYMASMLTVSTNTPTWIKEVVKSYKSDTRVQELIAECAVSKDSPSSYSYKNGILRFHNKVVVGTSTSLRTDILKTFHASELGAHSGERATYQRVKLVFHWQGLKQDVITFVKECPVCQLNKAEHSPYPGLLKPLPVPDFAWAHISMDFVEGLPLSENKRFTKYPHFIAMKHPITVQSVARAFSDTVFKLHGMPLVIVTDRDKIFTSHLWQKLFKSLKIKLHMSTSYHPQSYGQTERVNQCLENYLRCMCF